jgi:hypothetical protein
MLTKYLFYIGHYVIVEAFDYALTTIPVLGGLTTSRNISYIII